MLFWTKLTRCSVLIGSVFIILTSLACIVIIAIYFPSCVLQAIDRSPNEGSCCGETCPTWHIEVSSYKLGVYFLQHLSFLFRLHIFFQVCVYLTRNTVSVCLQQYLTKNTMSVFLKEYLTKSTMSVFLQQKNVSKNFNF